MLKNLIVYWPVLLYNEPMFVIYLLSLNVVPPFIGLNSAVVGKK